MKPQPLRIYLVRSGLHSLETKGLTRNMTYLLTLMLLLSTATGEARGNEARIWGPPGCGKTTYLSRQIGNAVAKYGKDRVLVTSFTRAAAAELAGRDLPLPERAVGTLHSHCYRALRFPEIAEAHIETWNKRHPGYRLSTLDATVDEGATEALYTGVGDELYGVIQRLRARCVPEERWPNRASRFSELWTAWKRDEGLVDFTDLLELGLKHLETAPGHPAVIFVDEGQDLSHLQLQLVRQWGQNAEYLVIAGDDDQTIYGFAGAAPEVLLEHSIPERFRHVLKQSYRVPRVVHGLSQAWIERVAVREPKEYLPRDADGELRLLRRGTYKYPEPVIDDAEKYVAAGKTVMILTTCGFMLEPTKAVLRKRGLPFHNPYRRKRPDWNPLRPPENDNRRRGTEGRTAAQRLLALLELHPSVGGALSTPDLNAWTPWLRAEVVLAPGARKTPMETLSLPGDGVNALAAVLTPSAFESLNVALRQPGVDEAVAWFLANLKPPRLKMAQYPVRVIERGGVAALRDTPKIIIGTGHSVKGGEADVVYLFPDLSPAGMRNWEGKRPQRDSILRLGYVMMTRAREALVLCEPAGTDSMPIAAVVASVMRGGPRSGGAR